MRIIPDETKITYLIDSHPDTPEDADYMEVCERDTIEITDAEWDEIYEAFAYWPAMNDPIWTGNRPANFAEYLRDLISLTGGK